MATSLFLGMNHPTYTQTSSRASRSRLSRWLARVKEWVCGFGLELASAYSALKSPEAMERPLYPVFADDASFSSKFCQTMRYEAQLLLYRISPRGHLLAWGNCLVETLVAFIVGTLTALGIVMMVLIIAPLLTLLLRIGLAFSLIILFYLGFRAMLRLRQF